jgi:pimeloyl-ACP methyl ester carboxylesterase
MKKRSRGIVIPVVAAFMLIALGWSVRADNALSEDLHSRVAVTHTNDAQTRVTVITHGLNGKPYHFSNQGADCLAYDEESLIERVKSLYREARVYVAKSADGNVVLDEVFTEVRGRRRAQQKYYRIEPNAGFAYHSGEHVILLFEATDANAGHAEVYDELHAVLDYVVYQISLETEEVPKVSLIGHSRGALSNLEYVIDHPFIIDTYISIGSAFHGIDILEADLVTKLAGRIDKLGAYVNRAGVQDIASEEYQEFFKNGWECAYLQNPDINAHALGVQMDASFIIELLRSIDFHEVFSGRRIIANALTRYVNGLEYNADSSLDKKQYRKFALVVNTLKVLVRALDSDFLEKRTGNEIDVYDLYCILNRIYFSQETVCGETEYRIIFAGDGLVNIGSQVPVDYSGVTNTLYTYDYSRFLNMKLAEPGMIALGHNFEPRDSGMIDYIIQQLKRPEHGTLP